MTIVTRVGGALLLIAAALPFVAALPGHSGESSCKSHEFWYEEKNCCLNRGGPREHHNPPREKQCPPSGWSWSKEHSCCVPHHPRPHHHPDPQCAKEWHWSSSTFSCERSPHHPHPPAPKPSDHHHGGWKREPGHSGESSCKSHEFWYEDKKFCLPRGGPSEHHKPPAEKQCPPSGWSWSKEHRSCVPHHPPQHHHHTPQCSKGWNWSSAKFCCEREPHHPHPPAPKPSGHHHDDWKREPGHSGESSCKGHEFWFEEKKWCLSRGGPSSHHEPPAEKKCPPSGWSWSKEHDCCVPHHPHSPHHPTPQCDKEWHWSPNSFWCERSPHHPHPPAPKPSGHHEHHDDWKREPGHSGESSCKDHEFWFEEKKFCLPRGGPSSHHEPPAEKKCPPSGWSWSKEHSCCVPHHPRSQHHSPPQCDKEWHWSPSTFWCEKSQHNHHHPHPPPPKPSGHHDHDDWKRSSFELCPTGLSACPIASASGLTSDFECLDTTNELESCGGCASIGEGEDCTAIKGAWNVGCEQGTCSVYTCAAGYKRSPDGKSCAEL